MIKEEDSRNKKTAASLTPRPHSVLGSEVTVYETWSDTTSYYDSFIVSSGRSAAPSSTSASSDFSSQPLV
jgi:hypothetical protein